MSYLTLFRTHVWDASIAAAAERARTLARSGEFVVAVDETNETLAVEGFAVLRHTSDFSALGLPSIPVGQTLWWNGDYVLYAARQAFPHSDHYVMIEFDVFLNCAVDDVLTGAKARGADLVAHDLKRIGADSRWYSTISEFSATPLWAFLPFVAVSGRAIDAMLGRRLDLAGRCANGTMQGWPYCETFVPTAIVQKSGMQFAPLGDFIDAGKLRYRPFLSVRDPGLSVPNSVAHPVLAGVRFIQATIANTSAAALFQPDGCLTQELQHEDPIQLRTELGAPLRERNRPEGPTSFAASGCLASAAAGGRRGIPDRPAGLARRRAFR